jgi:hypothetical protein
LDQPQSTPRAADRVTGTLAFHNESVLQMLHRREKAARLLFGDICTDAPRTDVGVIEPDHRAAPGLGLAALLRRLRLGNRHRRRQGGEPA